MTETEQAFDKLIAELNQFCGTEFTAPDGICAFRTAEGMQWQIALIPGPGIVAIETELGPLVQMPPHAAAALLKLNGNHALMSSAVFAADENDGMVRLQLVLPLAVLDGAGLLDALGMLLDIRQVAQERILAASGGRPEEGVRRSERRTFA